MKIDNSDFNKAYYANHSEAEFIKDQLASIPDSYGSEDNKIAFLKSAYAKIKPKNDEVDEKPKAKVK